MGIISDNTAQEFYCDFRHHGVGIMNWHDKFQKRVNPNKK